MLAWLAVGTAAAAIGGEEFLRHSDPRPHTAQPPPPGARRWSEAAGWGGVVPGPTTAVRISDQVLLDGDTSIASLLIEPTGSLTFEAGRTITLASAGNIEVRGALALAPEGAAVHTLSFPAVDEHRFQGGGMTVVDSDTGLWVTGSGHLRLEGPARTAWVRAAGPLRAGDTTVTLAAAPTGWRPGDELAVTPTAAPDTEGFCDQYDLGTIRQISGATVTLDAPLRFAHPQVAAGGGLALGAEVLNLTRNVRVEGTAGGRAHVHITSSRQAEIRYAALRWLGPRATGTEKWNGTPITEPVLGRYGLHFHMLGDTGRGTVVEGAVVRDTGSHAFVPHASHGITFRGCISHDTREDAYWWDGPVDTRNPQGPSNDITYDSCVASRTAREPNPRAYRLTGFSLGAGTGSTARGCIAVGVQGAAGASGYEWPETSEGVWTFENCLAHNNLQNGIFVWLNAQHHHTVRQFAAYHNGGWGIEHGAYLNDFDYAQSVLYGNAAGGVALHALGRDKGTTLDGLLIDAAGQSDYAIATAKHQLPGETVIVARSRLTGYRRAGIALRATRDGAPDDLAVLDCEFSGTELWRDPEAPPPKNLTVRKATGPVALPALRFKDMA